MDDSTPRPEPSIPMREPVDLPDDGESSDLLDDLGVQIEELVDLDPAVAADKAVEIADRLGRQLEEDEH